MKQNWQNKKCYPNYQMNLIEKIKFYNLMGLKKSLKIIKAEVKEKIKNNQVLYKLLKGVRIVLKIILFIPKKIIQFILYI